MENKEDIIKKLYEHAKHYRYLANNYKEGSAERDFNNFTADAIETLANTFSGKDIYKIGWDLPTEPDDIKKWGQKFHDDWQEAVKSGNAPNEDVSPGESLIFVAERLELCKIFDRAMARVLEVDVSKPATECAEECYEAIKEAQTIYKNETCSECGRKCDDLVDGICKDCHEQMQLDREEDDFMTSTRESECAERIERQVNTEMPIQL